MNLEEPKFELVNITDGVRLYINGDYAIGEAGVQFTPEQMEVLYRMLQATYAEGAEAQQALIRSVIGAVR